MRRKDEEITGEVTAALAAEPEVRAFGTDGYWSRASVPGTDALARQRPLLV